MSNVRTLGLVGTLAFASTACSGPGGSSPAQLRPALAPASMASLVSGVPSWNGQTLSTKNGYRDKNGIWHNPVINGLDMRFTPAVGDGPSGGHGPANTSLDGVGCAVSMSRNYHIHVFIGLYVNGTEYAIPRGVGVADPKDPNAYDILYATKCFYTTHTHDSTGIVHVEDDNGGIVERPPKTSKYDTSQLFAVWGITVTPSQFGQFAGTVTVYTSGQQYRYVSPTAGGTIAESTLRRWTGDPRSIPLYDHEVIWYLVGANDPTSLPSINFAPGY